MKSSLVGIILALCATGAHAQSATGGSSVGTSGDTSSQTIPDPSDHPALRPGSASSHETTSQGSPAPVVRRTGPQAIPAQEVADKVRAANRGEAKDQPKKSASDASGSGSETGAVYAPPVLGRPVPERRGYCERQIRIGGVTYPCDSPVTTDAENLRPFFRDNPEALEELDTYQRNRRRVRYGAYAGTTGLVLALAASPLASLITTNGARRSSIQKGLQITGFSLAIGSIVYGITYLRANEQHLENAIERHNDKNPGNRIEILFQTKF